MNRNTPRHVANAKTLCTNEENHCVVQNGKDKPASGGEEKRIYLAKTGAGAVPAVRAARGGGTEREDECSHLLQSRAPPRGAHGGRERDNTT